MTTSARKTSEEVEEPLGSRRLVGFGTCSDPGHECHSTLTFRQLAGPRIPSLERIVATQPYGHLCGSAIVHWQGTTYCLHINDEVRAVRGEGSCYLLSLADAASEAESFPDFQARRQQHPDLQGEFKESWEKLLAVSKDRDADGLRTILYGHMLSNVSRFQHHFVSPPNTDERECTLLIQTERRAQFHFSGPPCPVRKWAFFFLRPSTHVDERFMMVILDWLGHRVGIMNLMQVTRHEDNTPLFLHVPAVDLIPDTAVLLLKVLNIERQGQCRVRRNHFDRVSRDCPVEVLDVILVHIPSTQQGSAAVIVLGDEVVPA